MDADRNPVRDGIYAASFVLERIRKAEHNVVPWTRNDSTKFVRSSDGYHLVLAFIDIAGEQNEHRAAYRAFNAVGISGAKPILYGRYLAALKDRRRGGTRFTEECIREMALACQRGGCFWIDVEEGRTVLLRDIDVPDVPDLERLTVGIFEPEGGQEFPLNPDRVSRGDTIVCIRNGQSKLLGPFVRECLRWRDIDIRFSTTPDGLERGSFSFYDGTSFGSDVDLVLYVRGAADVHKLMGIATRIHGLKAKIEGRVG